MWDLSSLTREPVPPALGAQNLNHWTTRESNTIFFSTVCSGITESYLGSSAGPSREGNGTPLQYSCLENPMDGGAWWATVHGVAKNWTWLSDFTFTFHFHALEKEMATHSCIPALRIPGTGEPGGLPSMGSHSRTRLKQLSSSSSRPFQPLFFETLNKLVHFYAVDAISTLQFDVLIHGFSEFLGMKSLSFGSLGHVSL